MPGWGWLLVGIAFVAGIGCGYLWAAWLIGQAVRRGDLKHRGKHEP